MFTEHVFNLPEDMNMDALGNTVSFRDYKIELFCDENHAYEGIHGKKVEITSEKDEADILERIHQLTRSHFTIFLSIYINRHHLGALPRDHLSNPFQRYCTSKAADLLEFHYYPRDHYDLFVQSKLKIEQIAQGKIHRVYQSGVLEETAVVPANSDHAHSILIYPEDRKEAGRFWDYKKLREGYTVYPDGRISLRHPKELACCKMAKDLSVCVIEVENHLFVIKNDFRNIADFKSKIHCAPATSLLDVVMRAQYEKSYPSDEGKSVDRIIGHKDFKNYENAYIQHGVKANAEGAPFLFDFSSAGISDYLSFRKKEKGFDPCTIIDPVANKNIFIHLASRGAVKALKALIPIFPEAFLTVGQPLIEALLLSKAFPPAIVECADAFTSIGGEISSFFLLWIELAKTKKIDKEFEDKFNDLTDEQKNRLYEVGYQYSHPYFFQPAQREIPGDAYTLNAMWINKSKVPDEQLYLTNEGRNEQEQRKHFYHDIVKPVSEWAIEHFETTLDFWYDSEMVGPSTLERSQQMFAEALEGKVHAQLRFRDVRQIDLVAKNPLLFDKYRAVLFRADLIRALAAHKKLTEKETEYFVYFDLDVKPRIKKALFDQRTLNDLDDYGFVMADAEKRYENSFFILKGSHKLMIESHADILVRRNIKRAKHEAEYMDHQEAYFSYSLMFARLLQADGRFGKLSKGDLFYNDDQEEADVNDFKEVKNLSGFRNSTKIKKLEKFMPKKSMVFPMSRTGRGPLIVKTPTN